MTIVGLGAEVIMFVLLLTKVAGEDVEEDVEAGDDVAMPAI